MAKISELISNQEDVQNFNANLKVYLTTFQTAKASGIYSEFHGIKMDNNFMSAYLGFSAKEKMCVVESKEGKLLFVHGTPDGNFQVEGTIITHEELLNMVEEKFGAGEYILISCFNATHHDMSNGRVTLKRDLKTATNTPIFMFSVVEGTIIAFSRWNEWAVQTLQQPQAKKVSKNNLPESIRKKLNK